MHLFFQSDSTYVGNVSNNNLLHTVSNMRSTNLFQIYLKTQPTENYRVSKV